MKAIAAVILLVLSTGMIAAQQAWGNLDALIFRHLTNSGTAEAAFWLPDNTDPAMASQALAVVYEHIPGSAGSTGIATGLFVREEQAWVFVSPVRGLFGQSPRDVVFGLRTIDVTTTMLGPNDARCCPSVPTRWRIDLNTYQATPL